MPVCPLTGPDQGHPQTSPCWGSSGHQMSTAAVVLAWTDSGRKTVNTAVRGLPG